MDLIGEDDRFLQVQKSNVSVQILFPVILRMDDDFVNSHNLLCASLIPNIRDNTKGTINNGKTINKGIIIKRHINCHGDNPSK